MGLTLPSKDWWLTYGKPQRDADPFWLGVHANELLPNKAQGHEVQGKGNGLMHQHEEDGGLQVAVVRHHAKHIACTGISRSTKRRCREIIGPVFYPSIAPQQGDRNSIHRI